MKCSKGLSNRVSNSIRIYIGCFLSFLLICKLYIFIFIFKYPYCSVCSVLSICFHLANWHSSATLSEVFLCFFLSCKANARVQLAKTGQGLHNSQINCVVLCTVCV